MRGKWRWQSTVLVLLLVGALSYYPIRQFVRFPGPTAQLWRLSAPPGFEITVFASEPMVVHPVSLAVDEQNRVYVCETFGFIDSLIVTDEDLASRTFEHAAAVRQRRLAERPHPTGQSERLRVLEDRTGCGQADHVRTLADGFDLSHGVIGGVAARDGQLWLANAPRLWLLEDERRRPLLHGFGTRHISLGHDLHSPIFGPDGKLYFSMGDRGVHVRTLEGKLLDLPDTGSVLRCQPDGSELEVVAVGLRNPQKLAFDQFGNLFTGDNNCNMGDASRLVHVVEGGDSGWRVYYLDKQAWARPWVTERLWDPATFAPQRLPPAALLGVAPAGLAYYPGVGLPAEFDQRFLMCDFSRNVVSFAVQPEGAGFKVSGVESFLGPMWATDVVFGTDGSLFISDWVYGSEELHHLGRIFKVRHPEASAAPLVAQTRQLLAAGMNQRDLAALTDLLGHRDQRVRQAAQFALAARGTTAVPCLTATLRPTQPQLARIHALWALGQLAAQTPTALTALLPLLADADAEVRAQAARVLGERRAGAALATLLTQLRDPSLRVRYFAALALGKLGKPEAFAPVLEMLRELGGRDAVVQHAGVMALTGINDVPALVQAGRDPSFDVRLAVLLALARLGQPEIALFLDDADPRLVLEAARAIHDTPIPAALPALAALAARPRLPDNLANRVVNANFRLGTAETAGQLATLAASDQWSLPVRVEALRALADWETQRTFDRVLGRWSPLPVQSEEAAAVALRSVLPRLLQDSTPELVAVAAQAASALRIKDAAGELQRLVADAQADPRLRAQSLAALASLPQTPLTEAVLVALASPVSVLRCEAIRLIPRAQLPDALRRLRDFTGAEVEVPVRQAAITALGALDDTAAVPVLASLLDQALAGQLPVALQLDLLEAAARKPALKDRLARWQAQRPADPLAAWGETLEGGDAARGRKVFQYHPGVQCLQCHQLSGVGGSVGPPLDGIGSRQTRRYLLESIVLPNATSARGYEQVQLLLRAGSTVSGRVVEETEKTVVLLQLDGQRRQVPKREIEQRLAAPSPMPQDLATRLGRRELRDLVEYLVSLKEAPRRP